MIVIKKQRSVFMASWKLVVVFSYALRVLWDIYWRFEKLDQTEREKRLQRWACRMLGAIGVEVQQTGEKMLAQHCLRASNHISWLDIVVIYACAPCRFIAKAEVKKYPIIGRIARNAGTLFLDRTSIKDAIRVSEQISDALKEGHCIAFFPEATTSEGEGLLPLHASLFESALRAGSYVQTLVLRFHLATSTRAAKYAAYVHSSLLVTLWSILRTGKLFATVVCYEPFQAELNDTRHTICARVQSEMERALNRFNYNPDELSGFEQESAQMQLQFVFIDDALLWLLDADHKIRQLKQKTHDTSALMELRQLIHLLKGGAASVGFIHYSDAAKILEVCISRWIKTREKVTVEINHFIEQALLELRQWQSELPQGDIGKDQVGKLLVDAKALMAPHDIEHQTVRLAMSNLEAV